MKYKKCEKCQFNDRPQGCSPCDKCKGIIPTTCIQCDCFDTTESKCSIFIREGMGVTLCGFFGWGNR